MAKYAGFDLLASMQQARKIAKEVWLDSNQPNHKREAARLAHNDIDLAIGRYLNVRTMFLETQDGSMVGA